MAKLIALLLFLFAFNISYTSPRNYMMSLLSYFHSALAYIFPNHVHSSTEKIIDIPTNGDYTATYISLKLGTNIYPYMAKNINLFYKQSNGIYIMKKIKSHDWHVECASLYKQIGEYLQSNNQTPLQTQQLADFLYQWLMMYYDM